MYSTTGIDPSNFVSTFDTAFYFIIGISLIFLIGLTFLMLYFVFKYNRIKNKTATQIEGNTRLEIVWTVIPTILALVMFYFGWAGWTPMNKPPKDALKITSTARMWSFNFQYENGKQSPDLIVPVGKAVELKLVSLDVIHSVFIPAFRIKSDMVPGREKTMWFLPQREGEYDLYCAEYCGLRHSYMNSAVKVLSKDDYEKWYADSTSVTKSDDKSSPGAAGLEILINQGCTACHSSDGSKIVGPSFFQLYGEKQTVTKDKKDIVITADDEYIKRSIYEPDSEIVKGYPANLMQSYKETLNDEDVKKIIDYLKTLNAK